MSMVLVPKKLDQNGRCCGRKPIHYKTAGGMKSHPDPHFFCTRCNSEFSIDGMQRPNWAYLAAGDNLIPKYPDSDYWFGHKRAAA